MKLNISKKYALYFGVVSLIVCAALGISVALLVLRGGDELTREIEKTERAIYEENQGRTNYNIALYLSKHLFLPLYHIDIDAINRLINGIKRALPVKSFLVADDAGKVLTDGSRENRAFGRRLFLDRERLKKGGMAVKQTPEGPRITFTISSGGHVAGYGEILFSDEPLKSAVRRHQDLVAGTWKAFKADFVRLGMLGAAGVLAVAGLLSFFLSRKLSRPLLKLKDAADHVARGDLHYRVALDSADEIGALAEAFNTMVRDLRTSTERLQEANRKLRELDQLKSEFISVVSHEFRTPLTSIKAFTELMIMKQHMPEHRKQRLLSTISLETDRLATMVGDVLDLSRIESGQLTWKMAALSIEEVIARARTGIQPLADKKGILVSQELEQSLPSLIGDRDRLIQVVVNILSNAVKFTPSFGHIRISALRQGVPVPQIAVEISDTGEGIAEKDLEIIFEKFRRADEHLSNSIEGTGLGLAIARQIVESHGGRIWAQSRIGQGSTFIFTLPLVAACSIEPAVPDTAGRR